MSDIDYRLIVDPDELPALAGELRAEPVIAIDTETTGLDPYRSRLRLLQLATPGKIRIIDCFRVGREHFEPLRAVLSSPKPVKIAHNARFDGRFLCCHLGIRLDGIFDTYLASLLLSAGSEVDRHGLEPVVQRYLGRPLSKEAQLSDWSGELSRAQLDYAARDAAILLPLYEVLRDRLDEMDLLVAADLEFDCIMPVASIELAGVHLDIARWREQIARNREAHERVERELHQDLSAGASQMSLFGAPEPINLDSPAQVREALTRLGIELDDTREGRLHSLAGQYPVIARLLEHRHLAKCLSSFGENILEFINPVTGRIHPDYRQIGSPTGRLTSSSPSLQQIPHTPEYRSCFSAPAGRKLIIADYSQIEMRILAEFSRDEALLTALDGGADLHRQTAARMFGLQVNQITDRQRESAKGLNYGLIYGMGAEGLAARLDVSVVEARGLIERYFEAYPRVARWLEDAGEEAVQVGRARTASGRLWIFRLDPTDPAQQATLRRLGRNAPIQGTSSDLFKRAITLLDEALGGRDAFIVNSIHDELVVEAAEAVAGDIAPIVSRTMISAAREFLPCVPVEVDLIVADHW